MQFGLSGPLVDLERESTEVLKEAFLADPTWSKKVSFPYFLKLYKYILISQANDSAGMTPESQICHLLEQGDFRAEAPAEIRAGRLIIELFVKEVNIRSENFMYHSCR